MLFIADLKSPFIHRIFADPLRGTCNPRRSKKNCQLLLSNCAGCNRDLYNEWTTDFTSSSFGVIICIWPGFLLCLQALFNCWWNCRVFRISSAAIWRIAWHFSHMSGMGTSTFFQAANKEAPATGAFMAAITPFVDTIIVCTISGLVILSSPYWQNQTGAYLTAISFEDG